MTYEMSRATEIEDFARCGDVTKGRVLCSFQITEIIALGDHFTLSVL